MAVRSDAEQTLNCLSFCTGGGGLDLAVELALPCARVVCMVEREAFAVAHLVQAMQQGLMAPAPVWSDARTFNGRRWRGLVDGAFGGIPCQPHSEAGKRLGRLDPRDLWAPFRRALIQSGAWFCLIENVAGMLNSGGAERVWRDLQRLGFAVEGGLFTAREVGASHERARLFILGVADRNQFRQPGLGQFDSGSPAWREAEARWGHAHRCGEKLADTDRAGGDAGRRRSGTGGRGQPPGDRADLADAGGDGRREGADLLQPGARQPKPRLRGQDVVHAGRAERGPDPLGRGLAHGGDAGWLQGSGGPSEPGDRLGLFPPGPDDLPRWRGVLERTPELEPAFRRVADGLATRMDVARVDRLRLLGNGVVPLEGAYALRTLATSLARRSAGAAELVRMMAE